MFGLLFAELDVGFIERSGISSCVHGGSNVYSDDDEGDCCFFNS